MAPSHFFKIYFNIILPSTPGSSRWTLSSGFPIKILYAPLLSPICGTCPAHLILLDLINSVIFAEEYRSFSSSLCSYLHSPVTSSLLDQSILLSTLFSNSRSVHSSNNVSDQVSHPYKTTAKLLFCISQSLNCCIANWKTKDSEPNDSKHSLTLFCSLISS